MSDLRFAIAVLQDGAAYPIRADDDPNRNALRRLVPGAEADDETVWHKDSLDLLNEYAPDPGDHAETEGEPDAVAPPLVEANAFPWYAVFEVEKDEEDEGDKVEKDEEDEEDKEVELWVARFFGSNLPGTGSVPGVHIVGEDPALVDLSTLGTGTLSRRSVIVLARDDLGEEVSKKTGDHGGGGGVIRTEW